MSKLIGFKVFALAAAIAGLSACGGDDGDRGPAGPAGTNGTNGVDGTNGTNGVDGTNGTNGVDGQDAANSTIQLSVLDSFESDIFDQSAAEIVDFDPITQTAFVVNASDGDTSGVDMIDLSAPSNLPDTSTLLDVAADVAGAIATITEGELGDVNSLSVSGNTLVAVIAADNAQANGYAAFYQTDGTFLSAVEVGALPDMVTYTPDGNTVLVANEGEPSDDYTNDPEGTVSVIDVSGGEAALTQANVSTISFTAADIDSEVRISALAASVGADLEPEYIAVSADSQTAWVALQENNALAVLDLSDNSVTEVFGLGAKNHRILGNELDVSNRDDSINIANWPVKGLYQPDTIDAFEFNGTTYIVTANEGDAREYDDYEDVIRVADITDPAEANATLEFPDWRAFFPSAADEAAAVTLLTQEENLGRLEVFTTEGLADASCGTIATTGTPDATCVYEELFAFGSRSFSIWNGETGELVFDSGSDFERITAQLLGEDGFNATNDENGGDNRSDDKGPEPEAIEVASINGKTYVFVGLERVGGIMVYDATNPNSAEFVQYINNRDVSVDFNGSNFGDAGDLGPESIKFIAASDSPNGSPLLLVGNEVSGTTTVYQIDEIVTTATAAQ